MSTPEPKTRELLPPADATPTPGTELSLPERALAAIKLDVTVAQLTELASKTTSITAITNADGRTQAHSAAMVLREHRLVIEKAGKAAREDANKFAKEVIVQSAKLVQLIAPEEERLIGLRDEWDKAREAEKRAKAEADRKRKQAIQDRIQEMRDKVAECAGLNAAGVEAAIVEFTAIAIDDATFAELKEAAEAVHQNVLARLRSMHQQYVQHEADQERIRAEQAKRQAELDAEMAKQRAERELNQKRLKRIADIQQQTIIATTGKTGRKAGTRECIVETLAETEALSITEEEFGDLLPNAIASRDAAVQQIRGHLDRWDERARQTVIAEREQRELEALRQQQAERERQLKEQEESQRAEQRRIADENAARAQELADQQAKLERDQEQVRALQASLAAQSAPAPQPEPAAVLEPEPRTTVELPIAPVGGEVACKLCATPTRALHTQLCDGCYDLSKHITVATAVSAITLGCEALGIADRAVAMLKAARKAQVQLQSQAGAA